ncbi:UNVERIFIED_CONTAM: hypothetical protein RMT77_019125 [Armadillidium vulgare]
MDDNNLSKFGTVDYCVFAGMLIASGTIGLCTSLIGIKSPEEFLMGNRSFKPLPVAMSLLTSLVSSIGILGYSGEVYAYGAQIALFVIGIALAIVFCSQFALPVLHPLKLTSITEYIELRFKSKSLRMVVCFLLFVRSLLYLGVCLYAPTIALITVTKLSTITNIFLLGVVCTIYSALGGIRAVIWTDVFQLSVMLIGLLIIDVLGCIKIGGFFKTFYLSGEGGRLDVFTMNPSPFVRHSFFNVIAFGFFFYTHMFGSDQINLQRVCSVKSLKHSKIVLRYNIYGMILIYFLIFTGGLVAYVTYMGCDPMALGLIKKKEEIMPFFILDKLGFIPGLPGIFVATLVGGAMSSLSSVINSSVALIWRDVCLKFTFFETASERCATLTNKIISLILGTVMIAIAIVASKANSLIELSNIIGGTFQGPVLGVFLIGYLLPKCNNKGVWTGFILSSVFTLWITLGGFFYKKPPNLLPFSTDECYKMNFSSLNTSIISDFNLVTNFSMEEPTFHR